MNNVEKEQDTGQNAREKQKNFFYREKQEQKPSGIKELEMQEEKTEAASLIKKNKTFLVVEDVEYFSHGVSGQYSLPRKI